MQNKYDVSIIIPVYNTDDYIDECMQSIIDQNYDFERIEVILINDGSKDNSLEVCQKYSDKYDNVILINQENSGVSKARNEGIKKATGKYLMFLDSDDYVSCDTIRILIEKMDEHSEEVDLYTYPRYQLDSLTKKETLVARYNNYKKDGVYDVDKDYYFVQPTLNIITKNRFKDNILFDEKLFFHEDEDYVTKLIMKSKKFGYSVGGKYYYRIHETSTTKLKSNPYYCFDNYMMLYERLINTYLEDNKHLHPYIQAIILNDIKWRIKADVFYPYHYEGKEKKKAYQRIANVFERIEVATIVNDKNMLLFHKIYFLKQKKAKFSYEFDDGSYVVYVDKLVLEKAQFMKLSIEKFKVFDGVLHMTANVKDALLEVLDKKIEPKIYASIVDNAGNNIIKKMHLYNSNYSEYNTKIRTNDFYGFNFELDLKDVSKFTFYVEVEGKRFELGMRFSKKTPFRSFRNDLVRGDYIIHLKGKLKGIRSFTVQKNNFWGRSVANLKNNVKTIVSCRKTLKTRLFTKKKSDKEIWLYNDNKNTYDNAYFQFLHDVQKDDGISRYYVFFGNKEEALAKFGEKLIDHIVYYKSPKHIELFLQCDKVISAFHDWNIYSPFKDETYLYYDILKYEFIYLQHGILHAYMPWEYSNERNNEFDRVVISTKFERESFVEKYNYSKNQLICTGMPRLDNLSLKSQRKNKILYAPSWRKNLVNALVNEEWQANDKEFLNSVFYKESSAFLNSKELEKILEKNNLVLEFKNHPIFEKYNKLYDIKNKNVKIIAGGNNPSDYDLVITDYSSFVFDYVMLKIPVLYFVPDNDMFVAGVTHHYKKLDLPLEKGFGPVSYKAEELLKNLEDYIKRDFKIEKKYNSLYEGFFFDVKNRKEKLYKELMGKKR